MSRFACFPGQLLLSYSLSGYSCMVSPRKKQSFITLHASVSHQRVFNSNRECVANVEVPSDIWRRQADHEFVGVLSLVIGVEELAT